MKKTWITKNKKIKNAKEHNFDGILFRSGLELYCYKSLKQANISAVYEQKVITLSPAFEYNFDSFEYTGKGDTKSFKIASKKIQHITCKPDFADINGSIIGEEFMIECKGYANDIFPLKLKLLKKALKDSNFKGTYYLPRNQQEVNKVIELIKLKRLQNGRRKTEQPELF